MHRAQLCGAAQSINNVAPKCRIVPSDCSLPQESNRALYDDCTALAPQFAVERSNVDCLFKIEAETEVVGENSLVSPVVCCGCGDTIEIVGINGITVEVVNGAIKISRS